MSLCPELIRRVGAEPEVANDAVKARHIYEDYLFHFEKIDNEKTKFKLTGKKHMVKVQELDPSLMKEPPVYVLKDRKDLTKGLIRTIFRQQVCILRNF